MKQLATIDDINNLREDIEDIKDTMDNLLNRVIALEYTAQDLQRLIDTLKGSIPSAPSTYISTNVPYWAGIPNRIWDRTWTLNEDGSVSWTHI